MIKINGKTIGPGSEYRGRFTLVVVRPAEKKDFAEGCGDVEPGAFWMVTIKGMEETGPFFLVAFHYDMEQQEVTCLVDAPVVGRVNLI